MRDEHSERIEHMYGFSSERKMASVLMRTQSGTRLYVKVGNALIHSLPARAIYQSEWCKLQHCLPKAIERHSFLKKRGLAGCM